MVPDFSQQITESQQRLYGYIRSLTGNSASSWDILQETNIVLWKKQAEFQPGTNFGSWSFTIARFQVMAFLRDRSRDPLMTLTPDLLDAFAKDAEVEAEQLTDRLAALVKCREGLTSKAGQLLHLHYEQGQSMKVIAESLQQSPSAIKQAIFRARRALLDCIESSSPTVSQK